MKFKDCVVGMRVKVMRENPFIGLITDLVPSYGLVEIEKTNGPVVCYSPHMLRKLKSKMKKEPRVIWVNEYSSGLLGSSCSSKGGAEFIAAKNERIVRTIRFKECPEGEK